MFDTRSLRLPWARRRRRWALRDALDAVGGPEERRPAPPPPPTLEPQPPPVADDEQFPAIVVKQQEDARCRQALTRMGYFRVRWQYLRQRLQRRATFGGLEAEYLWPTMDFVQDWLQQERQRVLAQTQFPFLMALLATIMAGIAFAGVAAFLG